MATFCAFRQAGPVNNTASVSPAGAPAPPEYTRMTVALSRPATSMRQVSTVSNMTANTTVPVAVVVTGGTSFAPVSVAVNSSTDATGKVNPSPQAAAPANSPAAIRLH